MDNFEFAPGDKEWIFRGYDSIPNFRHAIRILARSFKSKTAS